MLLYCTKPTLREWCVTYMLTFHVQSVSMYVCMYECLYVCISDLRTTPQPVYHATYAGPCVTGIKNAVLPSCIDTSMQQLFDGGKLLSIAQEWLMAPSSPSSYLQATGALLIANMARNGEVYNVCGCATVLHVSVHG